MNGLVKQQFVDKVGRAPWQPHARTLFPKSWKLLPKLFALRAFTASDLLSAEAVSCEEEKALPVALLLAAERAGHLCLQFEPGCTHFLLAQVDPEKRNEAQTLLNAAESILTAIEETTLCRYEDFFYLKRLWEYESAFIRHFKRVKESIPRLIVDLKAIADLLDNTPTLLAKQKQACLYACENSLTMITGGPGTGKTYCAGLLIALFLQVLKEPCEIVLTAPTGKAAANLQKSLEAVSETPALEARTLHSLLFQKTTPFLTADLIVVDESSMIDAKMISALFAAVKPGARLVLLGDRYQLPPVEVGAVFADLIQSDRSALLLDRCMRTELEGIVQFAAHVNCGEIEPLKTRAFEGVDLHLGPLDVATCIERADPQNYSEDLNSFQSFCLLTPLRRGPFGVNSLNAALAERALSTHPKTKPLVLPILIVKNSITYSLFNGELGLLVCHNPKPRCWQTVQEGDYALFFGSTPRRLSALLLPPFELAYALSVHKSQGSEFDHVCLILPEGSERFGRELLYTAVTRARKKLEIWAEEQIFEKIVESSSCRYSNVGRRLI